MNDVAPDPGGTEREAIFTSAGPLIIMLVVFGMLVVLSVLATVGPPEVAETEAAAMVGYGPEDFPEIYANYSPLEGLDPESDEPFQVPPPPFRIPEDYPCSQCHEGDPGDPTPRPMELYHEEIVLNHDEEHRWCLDCHLAEDRDYLHLANGTRVPFEESYRLCGQCHGTHYRDWQAGAHGRRTGYWDGAKRYLLCVHCHDSHSPAFKPIEPMPPPVAPHYVGPHQMSPEVLTHDVEGDVEEEVPDES
jgi:hypothetical protein